MAKSKPFYQSSILTDAEKFKHTASTFYHEKNYKPTKTSKSVKLKQIDTEMCPQDIKNILDEFLYGLDACKRTISVLLWKIIHEHKPHGATLIVGQSGCGKTEMLSVLKKIYPTIRVINGASIIHSGYRNGCNGLLIPIYYLLKEYKENNTKYKPIMVIDEFDKFIDNNIGAIARNGMSAISELYKIIDGSKIPVEIDKDKTVELDTTDMIFIFTGAFSSLAQTNTSNIGFSSNDTSRTKNEKIPPKEKIQKQLPPELWGRIEDVVLIDDITVQDFKNIMYDKRYSPVKKISTEYGIDIRAHKSFIDRITQEAYETGTGVRCLNKAVTEQLNAALFENPEIKKLTLK